jgi:hypothetical protein
MRESLHKLDEVCSCSFHADLGMFGVEKADKKGTALVVALSRLLSSRFKLLASDATDRIFQEIEASGGKLSEEQLNKFVAKLNKALGDVMTATLAKELSKAVEAMYVSAKLVAAKEMKIKSSFNLVDKRAVEWMKQSYPWWVGDFHSSVLARKITDAARAAVVERGLAGRDAAKAMRAQLERIYSLSPGAPSPITTPKTFTGSSDQYWAGLANHAATTAKSFSRLSAMADAKLTSYSILAVKDERTCPLCLFMDGKTFSVDSGDELREKILAATDPEEYKKQAGWIYLKEAKSIFDEHGIEGLAKSSLALPPYHFSCRCIIEANL